MKKKLYICEKHHHVLLPWAWTKRIIDEINLITFDHHTDVHDAFLCYLFNHKEENLETLINNIDIYNDITVCNAIKKLKNDEHIRTALECGILNKVFVVSRDGLSDDPISNERNDWINNEKRLSNLISEGHISIPEDKTYPDESLYIIGTNQFWDDENGISTEFLKNVLSKIRMMKGFDFLKTNYILDIDLDYFHSYDSFQKYDLSLFRTLLSKTISITIATEPDYACDGIDPEIILCKIVALAKEANDGNLKVIDLRKQVKEDLN